jgi:hypothetical protein
MGVVDFRTSPSDNYVRMKEIVIRRSTFVPFRRVLGDIRREFMQILSVVPHGTVGSYLRGALQKDSADAVACLRVTPRS